MLKYAVIFLFLTLTISCKENSQIQKVKWLEGTWENKKPKGSIFETWIVKSNTELKRTSFKIVEGDTLILETIRLTEETSQLYFIPLVQNQNDQKPIRFALDFLSERKMQFVNLEHDFPNFITYEMVNQDSLVASINGKENKEETRRLFPMRRIK